MSDAWLLQLSQRCAQGALPGAQIFQRILATTRAMLVDRNYEVVDEVTDEDALVERMADGGAVMQGKRTAAGGEQDEEEAILVFVDADDRVGIKKMRQIIDAHPTQFIVVISIDGVTPFVKRELGGVDRVQFFTARELMHNLTHHALVPRHEALRDDEAREVARRYSLGDAHWMLLPQTDPVAKYYAYPLGTIVRITRTGFSQDPHVVYRQVVHAAPCG